MATQDLQLQRILDALPDAVVTFDASSTITYANAAVHQLLGWTREELVGKPGSAVVPRPPRADGKPSRVRVLHRDGRELEVELTLSPLDAGAVASMRQVQHERDSFRRLFEQAPAAIAVLRGSEFRYELSNALMDEMSGRALTGKTIREALPELADGPLAQVVYGVFHRGEPFVGREIPLTVPAAGDKPARDIFINAMYQPLRDDDGRIEGVLCFAYDVTDLVLSRQRAERAETTTALVANSVPQIIWMQTADGATEFVNDRWFTYTGAPKGHSLQETWRRLCHPDDGERLQRLWADAMARGQRFEAEVRIRRASDSTYRWHLSRSVPLKDEQGRVVRWVGSSTDIHERKTAEEASHFMSDASSLLSGSLDYRTTLKSLAALIVPKMADWCAVHLQEPGDPEPKQLVLAHADPERLKWAEEINRKYPPDPKASTGAFAVMRSGKPELMPSISEELLTLAAKDEQHLQLLREVGFSSAMTVPMTARGRTFGAITFIAAESRKSYTEQDLATAQELAGRAAIAVDNALLYEEAQRAVKVRDDFLTIASHELKTPLTPIQLHLQSLTRQVRQEPPGQLAPKRLEAKLDTMARQVRRLETLIYGLLDISRLTGKRLDLELEEVDLSAVIADVVGRFRAEAEQAKTTLDVQVPPSLVGEWDRLRVDQIVTNLMSNALKFGAGKPVAVTAATVGDNVRLQVRDGGIGIAPDDQARIFQRFERAVPTRHFGGFGLGLWIVRQIVEALGGTISVESAPGRGATFTVDLPRRRAQQEQGTSIH